MWLNTKIKYIVGKCVLVSSFECAKQDCHSFISLGAIVTTTAFLKTALTRTDVWTTWAVVIFRVKRRVVVKWWYLCIWSWFGFVSFIVMLIGRLLFCCYFDPSIFGWGICRFRLRSCISRSYGTSSCWHQFRGSCSEFVYQLSNVSRYW